MGPQQADVGRILRFKRRKSASCTDSVLRSLVQMAYTTVPFYKRTWNEADIRVEAFRGAKDVAWLPLTTKADLISHGQNDRLQKHRRAKPTVSRVTSGTSGQDLVIHMSPWELRFRQLLLASRMWIDARRRFPVSLVEAGAWIPPVNRGEVRHRSTAWGQVVHISRNLPLRSQIDALIEARPTVLTGCPSNLEVLATEMIRLGLDRVHPALVASRGETLRPHVRQLLRNVFHCRITDYYSAEEVGLIAWECPTTPGIMHVNRDACVLEVLDDDGRPCAPGAEGAVAVSVLFNRTMPLLRYVLGDRTSLCAQIPASCRCGSHHQTILSPAGRSDDFIILPDGHRISPRMIDDLVYLACVANGLENPFTLALQDYQIIQESATRVTFRFLSDLPPPPVVGKVLEEHLRNLHPQLGCEVIQASELQTAASGKRQRVISRCASSNTVPISALDP